MDGGSTVTLRGETDRTRCDGLRSSEGDDVKEGRQKTGNGAAKTALATELGRDGTEQKGRYSSGIGRE